MKARKLLICTVSLVTSFCFAQKNQIKAADKEFNNGRSKDAFEILKSIEYLIFNTNDEDKAYFYFLKGKVCLDLANKKENVTTNLTNAATAFNDLVTAENESGKIKYSNQVESLIKDIKNRLLVAAIDHNKNEKFEDSTNELYQAYLLDKNDTINLYYAASSAINAKKFDVAIKYFEELKKLNYSGKGVNYMARNKSTKEYDIFKTANERDLMVLAGTHERPKTENAQSKRGEILKNIALIYAQQGNLDKAKRAIIEARRKNPEDNSLAITEANLYLESKDYDNYTKLVSSILQTNPTDTNLYFNLGVLSAQNNKPIEAEKYYRKVMELDPKYINAYINLAALILQDEKPIIDQMNKLGTSTKDMKVYESLKVKRNNLFKNVIPILKKAIEVDNQNTDVIKTLMSVYNALEMTAEYKELKSKLQ